MGRNTEVDASASGSSSLTKNVQNMAKANQEQNRVSILNMDKGTDMAWLMQSEQTLGQIRMPK